MSGAVFVVQADSPSERVGDRTYYFCCGSCQAYFRKHRDEVLAKRGWS